MSMFDIRLRFGLIPCIMFAIAGLWISIVIICSLIPVYLQNRSVPASTTSATVYTLYNLTFTFNKSSTKQIRSIRSILSSPLPTSTMIVSAQNQLNILFNKVHAKCVITNASMPSTNILILVLKIYFNQECIACRSSRIKLIKQILTKGRTISIDIAYYLDCNLNPIYQGSTIMILETDIAILNDIPQQSQISIASLVQQTDPCLSVPKCYRRVSQEIYFVIQPDYSQDYKYYCFYWTPTSILFNPTVVFTFQNAGNNSIYLDDVTFNSSINLIQNGDFETNDDDLLDTTLWFSPCWTVCSRSIVEENPKFGKFSFRAGGDYVYLQQTISISDDEQSNIYYFGFWLKFNCNNVDPCTISATISSSSVSQ